jgi:hypothetical protein
MRFSIDINLLDVNLAIRRAQTIHFVILKRAIISIWTTSASESADVAIRISQESSRRESRLSRLPSSVRPRELRDGRDLMTSLQVDTNLRAGATNPTDTCYLCTRNAVGMKLSLAPRLAIVDHLEGHIGRSIEDMDSHDIRARTIAGASNGCSGLHLGELHPSVIPAAGAVMALLHETILHVLEVDPKKRLALV